MMTQAGKNSVLPSSLIKFNVRDAGTLIGLLIIIVTFSLYSWYFSRCRIYSMFFRSRQLIAANRSGNGHGHYLRY